MTDLTPSDLSHLSDEEFNALAPQGYHAPGPATALSPGAQAVLDAYWKSPWDPCLQHEDRLAIAAALRAAADQVVPGQQDEVFIDSLHLSTRTENALKRHGVFTVGDLKAFTYADLLLVEGIGVTGADQVVEALSRIGVSMVRSAKGRELNWQAVIARRQTRANLLAIAAELDGTNYISQEDYEV